MRYLSIDIMRGMTVVAMILVNTPGSWQYIYPPLAHAEWHGYTPTDLIFPFFLFIVGSAMSLSLGRDRSAYPVKFQRLSSRSLKIFFLGLALHFYAANFSWENLRLMGVLQRIGIAYFIAGLIVLSCRRRQRVLISIVILAVYTLLLFSVDEPFGLAANVVGVIDRQLLGAAHMWSIDGIAFDPEGLLSTIPCVVTVLLGYEATAYLSAEKNRQQAVKTLTMAALGLMLAGYVLSLWLPINKSLWTASYVLVTGAWAVLVLAVLVLIVDIYGKQAWGRCFVWFGANALILYVVSWAWTATYYKFSIAGQPAYDFIYQAFVTPIGDVYLASLAFAVAHILLFSLLAWQLYRKKIFIKV
ncbi:hypothetical protein SIN8267_01023 [Sinobacterium norvegicum]|uniref:Heparan-alpha-glucosaminide N-acetyltransferase catalytic domain-containing protein n=1 Tax=Sinobacterium norvegicum TaxID=1641715 RepID=A0ABM9AD47_9GAMM|nr:heparan-alpha-glucosaminide N-acetyltransferase domain-containing protein [Sinobacterium norvegicum]CAH0990922.1 hypothetical protein SIN8267_01023 [Sinobacterium norvegicum]